ncbi:hypothetical protein FC56_GL001562 [Lentilactobacillus senioris DSM 24302 = JCM 17472]|uniref:Uncharacterized protein n=1 Tax=Lentilactobacillus senioris DSM 24302 = JCM 17472 TaxID=1423802 RepID=A0A0R2D299_9LACO|nr:hypothetical protein [Lentilactobacillus senioris]KRM94603.1 hypothetical protein FC56_GL001562 [Lentilactobacillus senioris DSM 24302 = JCM 17472]
MGFSPKLILADICLIISILLAWYIQRSESTTTIRVLLIIVAVICLGISIWINFANARDKRKSK